jgi:hypothetical protein
MVTMLRTQGIPARYVVGYTPGQRVSEEEWVVRGYDSHAWVEVYLPDQGWVRFDPTPSGPRRAAEVEELTEARVSGESGVDVPGSTNGTYVPPTPTRTPSGGNGTLTRPSTLPEWWLNESQGGQGGTAGDPSANATLGPGPRPTTTVENNSTGTPTLPNDPAAFVGARDAERGNGGDGGSGGTPLPRVPLDVLAVWSVLTVGLAAGARRSGVSNALYRAAWLRYHPRTDDRAAAVEAAFDRVEYLLARDHRERRPGETVREYLADVDADERATKVASLRERARYAGGVSELEAERARNLAAAFVSDRTGVATTFNRLLS